MKPVSHYSCPYCGKLRESDVVRGPYRDITYECQTKLTVRKDGHKYYGTWDEKCLKEKEKDNGRKIIPRK